MDNLKIDLDITEKVLKLAFEDFSKVLNVGLSDLNGKVIYKGELLDESLQIDISNLKSGTYTLYLVCEEKVIEKTFKF